MDMNDLAKSLFNTKRAEGSSSVSYAKTIQGTVVADSSDGTVKVVIDGDCVTVDGTNEVEIGTVASLKEGDETIILLEGGGVMRPTALGSVGWGDAVMNIASEAQESADIAAQAASEALESAGEAASAASSAQTAAQAAQASATSASTAANSALAQLGTVEDVLGTVNWIAEHGTYALTQDTAVDDSKVYYIRSGSGTTQDPYVYTAVAEPTASGLSTYYELTVDAALSQYVASHLALTNAGLYIIKDNSGYKALFSNTGMTVYDPSGTAVATYGEGIAFDSSRTLSIGNQNAYIEYYDSDNDSVADSIRIKADSISFTSGENVATKDDVNQTDSAIANETAERKAVYGTCSTAAGTAAKEVVCDGFSAYAGARMTVKFANASTVNAPTLAIVDSSNVLLAAKAIWVGNSVTSSDNPLRWAANATLTFVYDGTEWVLEDKPPAYSCTCGTGSTTRAKAVTVSGAFIVNGTTVTIRFSSANTYASNSVQLNVSSTGATNIYKNNSATSTTNTLLWSANTVMTFVRNAGGWFLTDAGLNKLVTVIDANGIQVHPSGSTTDYAQINANGMDVVKGGTSVAQFGETARVGQIGKAHVIIDDSDMQFYGDDGTSIASFGANVRIGQESGLHQTSNASAISFYDENDVVAYISTDKFFSVNSEVEDAFYIGNYSLRNASDGKFVIGLRQ